MKYHIISFFQNEKELHRADLHAIDTYNNNVYSIKDGRWIDITKTCERNNKSKTKRDTCGARWFEQANSEVPNTRNTVLATDCLQAFADKLNEIQTDQTKHIARVMELQDSSLPSVYGLGILA